MEIMTSSGRRVKRRNMDDDCDDDSLIGKNRTRKSKVRRKSSSKKSSSKSRPQRAAARNALNLFSRITGTSTNGDKNESDHDSSESGGSTHDSSFISEEESDVSLPEEWYENSNGKEILLDQMEDVDNPHPSAMSKKRLILKLPNREWNNLLPLHESQHTATCSSSRVAPPKAGEYSETYLDEGVCGDEPTVVDRHLDLLGGCRDGSITWGGVKARSSKRLKMGESKEPKTEPTGSGFHNREEISHNTEKFCDGENMKRATGVEFNEERGEDWSSSQSHDVFNGTTSSSVAISNGTGNQLNSKVNGGRTPIKLHIRCCTMSRDHTSPSKTNVEKAVKTIEIHENHVTEENLDSEVSAHGGGTNTPCSESKDICEPHDLEGFVTGDSSRPDSNRKFTAVYRRLRSKNRANTEGDGGSMEASTSNIGKCTLDAEVEVPRESIRRARSIRFRSNTRDPNTPVSNFMFQEPREDNSIENDTTSPSGGEEIAPEEEWGSISRNSVRLRSTRSKKCSHYTQDDSPPRKVNHSGKSSWLMLCAHEEGSRYIPQRGDAVVYLRQGHQEYITHMNSRISGPWETFIKWSIRAVEFCKVVDLEYSAHSGSGESCCKMILKFTDTSSDVFGKSFKLTLPEVTGFPDFLVEKSRYDASMARNWTSRDKCQVWWKNEGEEDGGWWEGRIVNVKPKSHEFPDSPWERYVVKYKSDPTETHHHSPWELYDTDNHWEQPHIDDSVRDRLIRAMAKLEKSGHKAQDHYGVNKLKQVSQRIKFINRFPVPFSLEVIQSRLENNYYRSMEAVKHDVEVMLENVESYFGKNAELSTKMNRLSDWFRKMLSSL